MIRKILPFLLLSTLLLALNPEHPPLVKLLSGLALNPKHPRLETYNWRNANQWRYGDIFFDDNDADTMLFWGRLPVVLPSLILAPAVYCCAWEFYGWKAGCLALLLYVINPDMLAHGQVVRHRSRALEKSAQDRTAKVSRASHANSTAKVSTQILEHSFSPLQRSSPEGT